MFKALLKFMGDWERISREFKGVHFTPEQLKGAWRKLKLVMREEVRLIKSTSCSFDFVRWLRMAIRKLETQLGSRRQRSQLPLLIDTRKVAGRMDSLSLLVTARKARSKRCKGSTSSPSQLAVLFTTTKPGL
jgi:hypothetical protein